METHGVLLLLLLLLCAVSTCWGQSVYLTLGSGPVITTDNTEILITDIGEDATGGLPSLTCHTDLIACCRSSDNNGMGGLGQWTYPDGSVVLQNGGSANAGQQFYILRGAPQVIRLARRQANNPLTPTGFYCCTVPTTGGEMTLCINLVAPNSVPCSDNLPTISNGAITYAGGSPDNRPVGATASYSCFGPYTLVGVSVRTCGSDGEWSSTTAPVCQMITCSDLPSLTNGMISYGGGGSTNNRPVGTVATHTCDTGYTLNGGTTRTCGSDGVWSGSSPICQRTCSDLPPLMNGGITYEAGLADSRPVNTIATYTCDNGYTLTGGSFRGCQNDGTWDGTTPTCQLNTGPTEPSTTCPDLTVLANGMISYNMGAASPRPVDTVATYTCNTGYTLNGGSTRTCGSDGVWSGSTPTCQHKWNTLYCLFVECIVSHTADCPDLPPLISGMIMYSAGSIDNRPLSSSATYSCNTGYTLNGGTIRVCGSDGVWSGSAPTCQQITCSDLVLPTLMVSYNGGSPDIRPVNTGATYSCSNGYTLIGGDITRVCVNGGSWSGSTPTCQRPTEPPPTTCPDLTVPTNGVIIYSPVTTPRLEGTMATQICLNGYVPSTTSTATRVCLSNGSWSGVNLTCQSSTGSPCPQSDNTGAVVGGVVAVVAIVTGVVMVTYLVLRYKRGSKITVPRDIPLTDQGQSAAATYETVPATYEEIPASKKVKGDYKYTQNNAYSTVSGREAPAAGGIYDN